MPRGASRRRRLTCLPCAAAPDQALTFFSLRCMLFSETNVQMKSNSPSLRAGRVYRTEDFRSRSSNPPRFAKRLAHEGALRRVARGLYCKPTLSRFGEVPPDDDALLRAFLRHTPFVVTGPERWNALGLGSTAVFPTALVYNRKRSGEFALDGRSFRLRRVEFPTHPPPEWFVVDLLENADSAGVARADLAATLRRAVLAGQFDRTRLTQMAEKFGTRRTCKTLQLALGAMGR